MNRPIKKVLIITNFNIYDKANAAMRVAEKLNSLGCEICTLLYNKDRIFRHNKNRLIFTYLTSEEAYSSVDAVIVLGGDGTILESARRAAPHGTCVLGLNLGHLGYMAELELSEIDKLESIVLGDYKIETRSMLNIEILNTEGKVRKNEYALNDAVLSNGTISRIVDTELYEGGVFIGYYRADGMIVSTPTGSTAYSLSAGGPILSPDTDAMVITPICPHMLKARSIVLPTKPLQVKASSLAELSIDGQFLNTVDTDDYITIEKSVYTARLSHNKELSFYDILQKKL